MHSIHPIRISQCFIYMVRFKKRYKRIMFTKWSNARSSLDTLTNITYDLIYRMILCKNMMSGVAKGMKRCEWCGYLMGWAVGSLLSLSIIFIFLFFLQTLCGLPRQLTPFDELSRWVSRKKKKGTTRVRKRKTKSGTTGRPQVWCVGGRRGPCLVLPITPNSKILTNN